MWMQAILSVAVIFSVSVHQRLTASVIQVVIDLMTAAMILTRLVQAVSHKVSNYSGPGLIYRT